MQREGQTELFGALRELCETREDPDRRHGDVTRPDPQAVAVIENREGDIHRLPVEQRLAHPHEDDVGRLLVRVAHDDRPHLPRDLISAQVAPPPHPARRAEDAAQRAPDLRRDAQGAAPALGNQDRLDRLAVGQLPQEFLSAVVRNLVGRGFEPCQWELPIERRTQRGRQIGRVRPTGHRALPQAGEHLADPVRRLPGAVQPFRECGPRRVRGER